MGGFFGAVSSRDVTLDVFFGVDYHSHLGTRRGGMVVYGKETGFKREIHNIENTPFRTKFEDSLHEFRGNIGMGCISDTDPQPLLVRSHLGLYAISTVGIINNANELVDTYFSDHGHQFMAMSSGKVNDSELVAALINQKENLVEGIHHAQDLIEGSATILVMTPDGILAARDRLGRLPVLIGKHPDGSCCVSFESFAYHKLGYEDAYELGPREIVALTANGYETVSPAGEDMKICAFLWTYYGYPNSNYEGVNVEVMRYRNGEIMARDEITQGRLPKVDYVAGVPDSGIPHAIGFANRSGKPFARPFVKYTPTWPRSFMPANQEVRNQVAKMKQIPVPELIQDKKLLFVDDSIVRGTQLRETVEFLYESGAKEVHMRSACPPIMYG
ncbi:MAG: amidophosphoribosyltransferase, partial [Oscillospiraceae bacterium]|nr:amidophosphoribosyltransferase [Oscillospiraceae bacterium]